MTEAISRLFDRPVLWWLGYGALLAYGLYALWHIPVEVLPRFDYPLVSVIVHYPGATAAELETLLARPIEGQMLGLPDLVSLRSLMGQGRVQINARFRPGSTGAQDLQATNGALDRARRQLPAGVEPYAQIMGNAINEVADYSLSVPPTVAPMTAQRAVQTRIVPALRALAGVQRVEVFGSGDEALWVQPDPLALRHYGVSTASIVDALRHQVLLGPAGYLALGHQDVLIEARHLPLASADLAHVPIAARDGTVPLGELARIVRAPRPIRYAVSLDGAPGIALVVLKQPGASTLAVTRAVARTLKQLQGELPAGAHWVSIYDQGHLVGLIGSDLGRNLVVGGSLAVVVLLAMLGVHRGVGVLALSVPLALLMGIAGLYAAGQTLNLLTLGALSIAVGLLADDGIIVVESIHHRWQQGDAGVAGVWQGLRDIASPDVSGTLTTVAVFLPLLFVGGLAGLFFVPFALAMGLSLLASLAISLTLIPLLLARVPAQRGQRPAPGARLVLWLQRHNERLLSLTLRHPLAALVVSVGLLGMSIALLARVPLDFLPLPNEGVVLDSFSLPPGTALGETRQSVARITARLRGDPAVAHTFARIGSASDTAYSEQSSAGEIQVVLKPQVAAHSLDAIARRLGDEARLVGVQQSLDTPTIERLGESLSGLPQPFVITVYGEHIATLRHVSQAVVRRLRGVSALTDIFNNDAYPVTQLQVLPRTDALASYGITPATLYAQLRPALQGALIAEIPDGNYPLDLYVRRVDAPQLGVQGVRDLLMRTAKGWTPLGELSSVRLVSGPDQIRHVDGARALDILATPRGPLGSTVAAARQALRGQHLPAGYRVAFGGLLPRLEHAAIALGLAAAGAVLLLVGILAVQFEGLRVPGLLILDLPLAFTGGALALAISGVGLNVTGLVGFLTVVGISLNHGIVLLHRARGREAAGMKPEDAVRDALRVRFRPILLTTVTAVLGMLPTAVGWGTGAEPEQGLAIVILGGVIWSSLLSTNLIPALYLRWGSRGAGTDGPGHRLET